MSKYKKDTVGWLINRLEKFDKNMTVLSGDRDGWWYAIGDIDIKNIDEEGVEIEEPEESEDENVDSCVCIGVI